MDKFFTTWNGNTNAPSNEMLMDFHHINWTGHFFFTICSFSKFGLASLPKQQREIAGMADRNSFVAMVGSRCWKFGLSVISYNLQVWTGKLKLILDEIDVKQAGNVKNIPSRTFAQVYVKLTTCLLSILDINVRYVIWIGVWTCSVYLGNIS